MLASKRLFFPEESGRFSFFAAGKNLFVLLFAFILKIFFFSLYFRAPV